MCHLIFVKSFFLKDLLSESPILRNSSLKGSGSLLARLYIFYTLNITQFIRCQMSDFNEMCHYCIHFQGSLKWLLFASVYNKVILLNYGLQCAAKLEYILRCLHIWSIFKVHTHRAKRKRTEKNTIQTYLMLLGYWRTMIHLLYPELRLLSDLWSRGTGSWFDVIRSWRWPYRHCWLRYWWTRPASRWMY